MTPAPKSEATTLVSLRIPKSLEARIDEYAAQLQKQTPGVSIGRADAIRSLILAGLASALLENRAGKP